MVSVGDTLGVEEEFHVIDAETGELQPAARRVLRGADAEPELHRSMVETASAVQTGLSALRADLAEKRRSLTDACDRLGLAIVAAGTVPGSGARPSRVYPDERYERMAQEYRQLVDEQQVAACQVQVGVPDRDLAVRITRRVREWLPALLALSVSSPYFANQDTGYASYRTVVTSRWPTVGPPPDLSSAAEYQKVVDTLVASGVISDAGMVYFDARPSARYPTVEVRVADSCPHIDDVVLLAALARALVTTAAAEDAAGRPLPEAPQVLLRAATWRAARSGLSGHLVDPSTRTAVPAGVRIDALFTHLRPALEARGEWETAVDLLTDLRGRGTSATRQRKHATLRENALALAEETRGA
ncbi:glutamate--cysteine ligase [Dactylosporangium sucinum]|uniref:Putative glutamate--cysteine ligase 2 n=1 Tax=Dactylosporangium sucinum TaxID=1424081 RepID=A0A917U5H7_9ACTN|nr:glutamate--cysteine ligase [Dactylosporangium sucinum]GGM59805.1 putative glutamate--cysteine ligase 2-2 [Dactylosporangium sucinum]